MNLIKTLKSDQINTYKFWTQYPINTFYIKHNYELIPNTNYYILLFIGESYIAHTNNFEKVVLNEKQYYKVDFFVNKFTIPQLQYHYFSLFGVFDTPHTLEHTLDNGNYKLVAKSYDTFDKVYIEPNIDYKNDADVIDHGITYHNSDLTNKIRQYRPISLANRDYDNGLRFSCGMAVLCYSYFDFFIDNCKITDQ